ncbi:MAG: hypothetical protein K6G60_06645 [Lachnospiraceae bacterium]|nr:hypothetical protein [Lachnospiraceae bacterium]
MKKKFLIPICICEALIFIAITFFSRNRPTPSASFLSFPFEQFSYLLELLSKTGIWGNGVAVALWVGVSLIPALFALHYANTKECLPERITLFVLPVVILHALYKMIHPYSLVPEEAKVSEGYISSEKGILGISIWSVLLLYVILRLLRLFKNGDRPSLVKYMHVLLHITLFFFVGAGAVNLTSGVTNLFTSADAMPDKLMSGLLLAASFVPIVFDIFIIFRFLKLLEIAQTEEQENIKETSEAVTTFCCTALAVTGAVTAFTNVLQTLVSRWLTGTNATLNVPFDSIIFVVLVLLFAKVLTENKQLRDDNGLFI